MKRKEILKVLDYVSYIALLVATVLIIVFEVTANLLFYRLGLYMYEVCFLVLIVFTVLRIFTVFKKGANQDEEIALSKGQKAFLIVKLVLTLIGFCLTSAMLIYFK